MDATNVKGQTALQLAYEEENDEIVRELKKEEVSRKNARKMQEREAVKIEMEEDSRTNVNQIMRKAAQGEASVENASADGRGGEEKAFPRQSFTC